MGCIEGTLPLGAGATFCRRGHDPSGDLVLTTVDGEKRTVSEWLTNFHLLLVAPRPVHERERVGARRAAPHPDDVQRGRLPGRLARHRRRRRRTQFLGPLARRVPDLRRSRPHRGEGVRARPAARARAGSRPTSRSWARPRAGSPRSGRRSPSNLAEVMSWRVPLIPDPGDPGAFAGTPRRSAEPRRGRSHSRHPAFASWPSTSSARSTSASLTSVPRRGRLVAAVRPSAMDCLITTCRGSS